MNRLFALITVFGYVSLATCGVYEGARDGDGTKLMLVLMWVATYVAYIVWKRRAIETQVQWTESVIRLMRQRGNYSATSSEPAPGVDLVDHDDGDDAGDKTEAKRAEDNKE